MTNPTTSNTELAAQARQMAAALEDRRSNDLGTPTVAAALMRQLADAVESKAEPVAWVAEADVKCFGKGDQGGITALLQKKGKFKYPLYAAHGIGSSTEGGV